MRHDLHILKPAPHFIFPEPPAPHWRTREEKMALLDPCPELTLASKRMRQADALLRAAYYLFGCCVVCLALTTLIALAVFI